VSERAHGVVAAGDPQTAEAGAEVLRQGGTAIDAVVAAAFASFVCELPLCSPLGGGVCLVERGSEPPVAFDMFARTPGLGRSKELPASASSRSSIDFEGVSVCFGAASQVFHVGRASVAVPLALSGLLDLHRRYGIRPLREVLAPAIALGRDGYTLGPGVAFAFDILRPIVNRTSECRGLFLDDAGEIASTGARLRNADMARTFDDIASRPEAAVREIYAALAREMGPDRGGLITTADVSSAAIAAHEPVIVEHDKWRLATMPSPSTGGILVALGLRLLEGVGRIPYLSREHALTVARVQEALLAERDETFAERCADPVLVKALLDDERLAIARETARNNVLGSTTHISVIDEQGTAVSLTLSNGEGSGHVLSGTGMIANNLLGEEDLHPRGFHVDPPGKPLATMMAPTLLSRGSDRIALGSGGSNRLRTAILQVLVGLIEHGVSPATAVAAPRLHLEIDGVTKKPRLAFEAAGRGEDVVASLRAKYPVGVAEFAAPNMYFGGVHLAMRSGDAWSGVGDPRRGGACVVV
jgi:gamma-glutamyltranspeptidase/glutathione hydrolase